MIKVLIVDDMEQYRNYFKSLLATQNNIEVAGIAVSGSQSVMMARSLSPDIILMDIQMESSVAGLSATSKILKENPEIKIIILTIHDDSKTIMEAYMNGITDYLLKTSSPYEIIMAINEAATGSSTKHRINTIIKNEMIRLQRERDDFYQCFKLLSRLSKNELEILGMLCEGKKYRKIADERFIEESTVRCIVSKISKKLGGIPIRDLTKKLIELNFINTFSDIFNS